MENKTNNVLKNGWCIRTLHTHTIYVFTGAFDVFTGAFNVFTGAFDVFTGAFDVFTGAFDVFTGAFDVFTGAFDVFTGAFNVFTGAFDVFTGAFDVFTGAFDVFTGAFGIDYTPGYHVGQSIYSPFYFNPLFCLLRPRIYFAKMAEQDHPLYKYSLILLYILRCSVISSCPENPTQCHSVN